MAGCRNEIVNAIGGKSIWIQGGGEIRDRAKYSKLAPSDVERRTQPTVIFRSGAGAA